MNVPEQCVNAYVECIVIGAGIIGLACARRLARAGVEVILLEAADTFGTETSSRNSEVIHAGIYYPKNSLKAELCVAGKEQLYEYCSSHGIHHKKIGKLIVATTLSEVPLLQEIKQKAVANSVFDLQTLSALEVKQLEPNICAEAALFSPSTGIIDSHQFMLALLGDAEADGAMLAVRSRVVGGCVGSEDVQLQIQGEGGEIQLLNAKMVINASGLSAPIVAGSIQGIPSASIPKAHYCKGSYFTLAMPSPFTHLVYPVPNNSAGLGVHLTLDLAGQARFGPDTEWIDAPNYEIDMKRADSFYEAIRRYWPALENDALQPGYIGIRPKIVGSSDPAADFIIQSQKTHGVKGLINLYGIESPGLTASLSIADRVYSELCV